MSAGLPTTIVLRLLEEMRTVWLEGRDVHAAITSVRPFIPQLTAAGPEETTSVRPTLAANEGL